MWHETTSGAHHGRRLEHDAHPPAAAAPARGPGGGALLQAWLTALALALIAGGLWGGSLVSLSWLNEVASRYATSGSRGLIQPAFYDAMIERLRIAAAIFWGLALTTLMLRHRVAATLAAIGPGARMTWASACAEVAGLRREPRILAAFVAVVLLAAALRLVHFDQPMRYDESWTAVSFVEMPAYMIPLRYNVPNNHVLNTLLAKLSVTVFGNSEAALRLPAFLFGLALVPATFFLVRALCGSFAGLLAAALVATSSPLIEFSTNARGYSAVCFAFVVLLLVGRHALRTGSPAAWALYAAAGALGAYAIPIMALPASIAFAWLGVIAFRDGSPAARRRSLTGLLAANLAMAATTALLYAPILAVNGPHALTSNEGVQAGRDLASALPRLGPFAAELFETWTRDLPRPVAWLLLGAALLAPLLAIRARRSLLALGSATIGVITLYLVTIADLGFPRVWLFVLVVWLVLAAAGIAGLLERVVSRAGEWTAVALALSVAVAGTASVLTTDSVRRSSETGLFTRAEEVTSFLLSKLKPNDIVLVDSTTSAAPMAYYARRKGKDFVPVANLNGVRWLKLPSDPRRAAEVAFLYVVVNTEAKSRSLSDLLESLPGDAEADLRPRPVFVRPGVQIYQMRIEEPLP